MTQSVAPRAIVMDEIYTRIEIDAPPAKVWSVWMDFDKFPEWNPFLPAVKGDVKKGKVWEKVFITRMFGRNWYTWLPMRVIHLVENQELSWRGRVPWILAIFSFGIHYFTLEERPGNKTIFAHRAVLMGPLMTLPMFLFPALMRKVAKVQEEMVVSLKQRCEGA